MPQSTSSVDGYLSSADWAAFNSKLGSIAVAPIDTLASSAAGLRFTAGFLGTQSASVTAPGMVNTTTQQFAGIKTFTGLLKLGAGTEFLQISTPSSPPGGSNKLYFKTDGNIYKLNSAGTESPVTGAGAEVDPLSIHKDGTVPPTANISWANFGLDNVGYIEIDNGVDDATTTSSTSGFVGAAALGSPTADGLVSENQGAVSNAGFAFKTKSSDGTNYLFFDWLGEGTPSGADNAGLRMLYVPKSVIGGGGFYVFSPYHKGSSPQGDFVLANKNNFGPNIGPSIELHRSAVDGGDGNMQFDVEVGSTMIHKISSGGTLTSQTDFSPLGTTTLGKVGTRWNEVHADTYRTEDFYIDNSFLGTLDFFPAAAGNMLAQFTTLNSGGTEDVTVQLRGKFTGTSAGEFLDLQYQYNGGSPEFVLNSKAIGAGAPVLRDLVIQSQSVDKLRFKSSGSMEATTNIEITDTLDNTDTKSIDSILTLDGTTGTRTGLSVNMIQGTYSGSSTMFGLHVSVDVDGAGGAGAILGVNSVVDGDYLVKVGVTGDAKGGNNTEAGLFFGNGTSRTAGVFGIADSDALTSYMGGYFRIDSNTGASSSWTNEGGNIPDLKAALVADGGDSGSDIFIARNNSGTQAKIDSSGNFLISNNLISNVSGLLGPIDGGGLGDTQALVFESQAAGSNAGFVFKTKDSDNTDWQIVDYPTLGNVGDANYSAVRYLFAPGSLVGGSGTAFFGPMYRGTALGVDGFSVGYNQNFSQPTGPQMGASIFLGGPQDPYNSGPPLRTTNGEVFIESPTKVEAIINPADAGALPTPDAGAYGWRTQWDGVTVPGTGVTTGSFFPRCGSGCTGMTLGKVGFTWAKGHIDNLIGILSTEYSQITTPANPPALNNKLYFKADNELYKLDSAGTEVLIAGGGEANTSSNSGVGGVGIVLAKAGIDLPFKSINAGSNKISVADDGGNFEVDIDVNEANLSLTASQISDYASATATFTNKTIDADGTGNVISNIEDADIKAAAAIALNKLAATTINRALISDGTGFIVASSVTATELGLLSGVTALVTETSTNTFTNKTIDADGIGNVISNIEDADIKAAAAIALNKLAATTISRALVSDGSGFISPSAVTATELGLLSGVTALLTASSTNTFTNKTFDADGTGNVITNIENADIKAAAAIALNKLAATTINRALISDGTGFVSPSTVTATELALLSGLTDIATAASTTTFTNKTIDADGTGNSITNIEDADIKTAAAIAVNKLAALTVSENVVTDGSGFLTTEAKSVFGDGFEAAESLAESTTVSTTYVNKLTLTTASLAAGDYYISWSASVSNSNNGKLIGVQVQVDDTTTLTDTNTFVDTLNLFESVSGNAVVTLTAATHTIDLDFKTSANTGSIQDARFQIWRVN